ncbi:MAG: hypothetical protein AAGA91_18145 [Pseudomonadota bacterium]
MSRSLGRKTISAITVLVFIGCSLTVMTLAWKILTGQFYWSLVSTLSVFVILIIVSLGIAGAYLAHKGQLIGKQLLIAHFVPQLASYHSESISVSFVTGISFNVSVGSSGGGYLNFNLYALVDLTP